VIVQFNSMFVVQRQQKRGEVFQWFAHTQVKVCDPERVCFPSRQLAGPADPGAGPTETERGPLHDYQPYSALFARDTRESELADVAAGPLLVRAFADTSAYQDNQRSIVALARLGFSRVPVHAEAPEEALVFFSRCSGAPGPDETSAEVAGLRALCQGIDSPFVLVDEVIP